VRRRMIQSSRERVIGIEDDLLDPEAAPPDMRVVGDGALLASLSKATGRGMRDIVATIQREQDEAIRSPASGVTIVTGGPGTGKTAVALHRAAYLLYSDRNRFAGGGILVVARPACSSTTSPPCCPRSARTPRRCARSARWCPATTPPGSTRPRSPRSRARCGCGGCSSGPRTTRCRARRRSCGCSTGARCCGWTPPSSTASGGGRCLAAPGATRCAAPASTVSSTRSGPRPGRTRSPAAGKGDFEAELADRGDFREFLKAWWPRFTPMRVLRWLAEPGRLRAYANGLLSREEIATLQGSFDALASRGPTIADVALLDELDELMGRPKQPARRTATRSRPRRHPGGQHLCGRQAAARAQQAQRDDDYRSTRMWSSTSRRTSRRAVADDRPSRLVRLLDRRSATRRRPPGRATPPSSTGPATARSARASGNSYALTTNYRNSSEIFAVAASVIHTILPDLPLPGPCAAPASTRSTW